MSSGEDTSLVLGRFSPTANHANRPAALLVKVLKTKTNILRLCTHIKTQTSEKPGF